MAKPTTAPSRATRKKKPAEGVVLTQKEFALLYTYLDREHTITWDVEEIGLSTKLGKQLWDRVQELGGEHGLLPQHQVRWEDLVGDDLKT